MSARRYSSSRKHFAKLPTTPHDRDVHPLIDQPEGIIENKIAAYAVRKQLEDLGVIHWPLLLVNLQNKQYVIHYHRRQLIEPGHTSSAPVTMTSIPPLSFEGCASRVATLCSTLLNGRVLDFTLDWLHVAFEAWSIPLAFQ